MVYYLSDHLSESLEEGMQDQLRVDLQMLNDLLLITHIEGIGWDASRNQSMQAIRQARLLAQSELN